jgi:hypothetical protein
MAARRLLIVMLVMLGISTVAAALVPTEPQDEREDEPTTTTSASAREPRGRLLRRTVDARGRRPEVVRVRVGDQLELLVGSRRSDVVEIAGLGELREVDRDAPARFDVLPFERGVHPIRLLEARRTIGRIVVDPRQRGNKEPTGKR